MWWLHLTTGLPVNSRIPEGDWAEIAKCLRDGLHLFKFQLVWSFLKPWIAFLSSPTKCQRSWQLFCLLKNWDSVVSCFPLFHWYLKWYSPVWGAVSLGSLRAEGEEAAAGMVSLGKRGGPLGRWQSGQKSAKLQVPQVQVFQISQTGDMAIIWELIDSRTSSLDSDRSIWVHMGMGT